MCVQQGRDNGKMRTMQGGGNHPYREDRIKDVDPSTSQADHQAQTLDGEGSNPSGSTTRAPVAQRPMQLTLNQRDGGSSPPGSTMFEGAEMASLKGQYVARGVKSKTAKEFV
jgi:hypothetical protein